MRKPLGTVMDVKNRKVSFRSFFTSRAAVDYMITRTTQFIVDLDAKGV